MTRPYVPYDHGEIPETRVDHHRQPPNRVNLPVTLRKKKPVNQPQSSDRQPIRQPNVKNPTLPTQAPFDWGFGSFDWSRNCDSIPATHTHLRDSSGFEHLLHKTAKPTGKTQQVIHRQTYPRIRQPNVKDPSPRKSRTRAAAGGISCQDLHLMAHQVSHKHPFASS